jgi:hypothetical protein
VHATQGEHKETTHRATLRLDGQVRYGDALYASPSAAARAAVGRNMNGWWFWHFRHKGEWVRLRELRR